jgi:hypothetical protein
MRVGMRSQIREMRHGVAQGPLVAVLGRSCQGQTKSRSQNQAIRLMSEERISQLVTRNA